MAVTAEAAALIEATFPSAAQPDLRVVLSRLRPSEHTGQHLGTSVFVDGEEVQLLSRFYSPEPRWWNVLGLPESQRRVLACLYAWHADGYVRERSMAGLRGDDPWLVLYMLRLVGDYIEPIWERALSDIDAIPRVRYAEFAEANPAYIAATCDRIVAYHRHVGRSSRDFVDNPAYKFMVRLGLWQGPQGRRWIALGTERPPVAAS